MVTQAAGPASSNLIADMQGGVDSQSLETILEFKDAMFGGNTSRGYSLYQLDAIRAGGNSSTMSNGGFLLPQTTNRTLKTNRSYLSHHGEPSSPQKLG